MRKSAFVLFAACLLAAAQVPQPADAAQFEITPFAGHTWGGEFTDSVTGNTLKVDETANYGLMVDVEKDDRSQYELYMSRQSTQLKTDGGLFTGKPLFDLDIWYVHIGGTYTEAEGRMKPFVAGGLGVTYMDPKGPGLSAETKFSFNLGVGVKLQATEHIGLRLEGRWFGTLFNGGGSVFCSNGACALNVQGDLFSQFVANAGVSFAF
jgi:opacity protein-like surface antigen